jgi:pyroglutamyl-peptidase
MSLPKILVTGFGPFPGAPNNPSAAIALSLARSQRAAHFARVRAAIIPTVYAEIAEFPKLIAKEKPDAVLMFGLASKTPWLRIESWGRNRASLFHADAVRGKSGQILIPGAPSVLPVRAPVRRLLQAARSAGVDVRSSRDAGGYLCNAAIFHALVSVTGKKPLVAFVHIPSPRGRVKSRAGYVSARPTMAMIQRAAEAILIALARAAKTSG